MILVIFKASALRCQKKMRVLGRQYVDEGILHFCIHHTKYVFSPRSARYNVSTMHDGLPNTTPRAVPLNLGCSGLYNQGKLSRALRGGVQRLVWENPCP